MNQDVEIELCVKEVMDNKGVSISELSRMADIKYDIVKRYYNGEIVRYDSEVLKTKFAEFVYSGVPGELCRFYYSINERDPEKIHKFLIHFLIDNENFNICDIQPKLASIAAKKECARSKRWMFDFDIDDDALVNEFIEDIKAIDSSVEVNKYKTPHGYGVIVSHGFDTRTLYEKWDRSKTECKKDDLMCIDWKIKK